MSGAKENPCRKFQANIFNKSKCQNCFKPRELHLLTDQDLNQAKPIYGGWLCLAPEGTDFDNPMQRSRKWQRRFFVLYEHGCLRFALDESPSTLPQGTVNMNQCTDVIDAEPRTGQKNALCIITPEQEYFIRGENKEIIHGWSEQLVVYPRTNKQNQKKKRKVEPTTSQEPGPAKVAVTGSGIPEAEKVPDSRSIIWQEELHSREADVAQVWPSADIPPLGSPLPPTGEAGSADLNSDQGSVNGDETDRGGLPFHSAAAPPPALDVLSPTGSASSRHSGEPGGGIPRCHSPAPSDPFPSGGSLLSNGSHISGSMSSLDSDASVSTVASSDSHPAHRAAGLHDATRSRRHEAEARKAEKRSRVRSPERQGAEPLFSPERSRANVIEKLEALELENAERMEVEEAGRSAGRQGRSETRRFQREERDPARGSDFHHSTLPPLRRAKSLDRRTTESVMTPDLLNFKKGWMVKVDEQGQWKKYWFVLTDHSLRYYKDSIAEEASDLDGEIDLTTCYNVTEYQVQRNYGFQIHTQEAVYTLSAMTAGIRRNWIQAVMKNVRPSTAPDVASLVDDHGPCGPLETLPKPDVAQDSPSSEASSALAQQRAQEADVLQAEFGDLERSKRREERRKRYETVTAPPPLESAAGGGKMDVESGGAGEPRPGPPSPERQQRVQDEIEHHWQQVEQTPIREERRVPLSSSLQGRETSELEKLLESYKKGVEELKVQLESCHHQLADSNHHKLELEDQLRTALEREHHIRVGYISPLESPLGLETDLESQKTRHELVSSQAQNLKKKYQETKELLQQQELKKRSMQAQLGLSLLPLSIKEPDITKGQASDISETQPPEPVHAKTFSILLQDSEDKLQELEKLISGSPLTVRELVRLLSSRSQFSQEDRLCIAEGHERSSFGDRTCCQKVFESLKHQQELEIEALRRSLTKASDSVRDYEVRLLSMEGMLGRAQRQKMESLKGHYGPQYQIEEYTDTNEARRLSQEVELLANENKVLNQHYQEILNQLTEADREIERLKAELFSQQGGQQHLLVVEELKQVKAKLAERDANSIDREFYEKELNKKSQKLQEALIRMEVLGSSLKDTERKLHLKEATLKGLGFQVARDNDNALFLEEKEDLHRRLEAAEARLCKQERQLCSAEKSYMELQDENAELKLNRQKSENVYHQRLAEAQSKIKMLQENVVELKKSDGGKGGVYGCEEETHGSENPVSGEKGVQQVVKEIKMKSEALRKVCEVIAKASSDEELQSLVQKLYDSRNQKKGWVAYVEEASMEAHSSYLMSRLDIRHQKEVEELQLRLQAFETGCKNCAKLKRQNEELQIKLEPQQWMGTDLQAQMTGEHKLITHIQIEGEPIDSLDKAIQLQDTVAKYKRELREVKDAYELEAEKLRREVAMAGETLRLRSEENVKEIDSLTVCMENMKKKHELERSVLKERFERKAEELRRATPPGGTEAAERIRELESQINVMTSEMKQRENEGDTSSLRLKYERDLENLKATCERGFTAMEESHQKVVDELQRKHQRELENLHEEKERLLAEETAATIAAIEAMKNAHRSELERELDKARKASSNTENADIDEIRRLHEEELCSFHREIEVLSEQYSQKCLENAHLAQALEAERQALRQCQRENQELNAHNQELNNRLAAEITKLRSMTSEDGGDTCTLIQGKELYELEVMLRVKESEVQYLKQEINSLKDELQAAQRDKKYATDKYKDIYTELSIVRAKAERDLGRLRDQLQLAHEALGDPSMEDVERSGYDIMKSKSNPDILKMAAAAAKRSERTMRSKSVNRDMPWDS
ncbi:hypothetical protein AAFF_G00082380 [Aldrovandia affinis]|uniref:PH domain-containing protein n=1 Tax=Aldrovandia affinis TaxID=143900 RepID=A0AAD7T3L1_9TELE|nr:hypothetical protein AAFF_G00082380 [Aldrovandia affinis]